MFIILYIKSLFVLKDPPKAAEVKVSDEVHKIADILRILGFLVLIANFIVALVRLLFFSELKMKVGELDFLMLIFSVLVILILSALSFIKINNAHTDVLKNVAEEKYKVVLGVMGSLLLSVYFAFLAVNEVRLAGKYNREAHDHVCEIYLSGGGKSKSCIDYENEMKVDKSSVARILYFYDFK